MIQALRSLCSILSRLFERLKTVWHLELFVERRYASEEISTKVTDRC